jgi:hypothetical protein
MPYGGLPYPGQDQGSSNLWGLSQSALSAPLANNIPYGNFPQDPRITQLLQQVEALQLNANMAGNTAANRPSQSTAASQNSKPQQASSTSGPTSPSTFGLAPTVPFPNFPGTTQGQRPQQNNSQSQGQATTSTGNRNPPQQGHPANVFGTAQGQQNSNPNPSQPTSNAPQGQLNLAQLLQSNPAMAQYLQQMNSTNSSVSPSSTTGAPTPFPVNVQRNGPQQGQQQPPNQQQGGASQQRNGGQQGPVQLPQVGQLSGIGQPQSHGPQQGSGSQQPNPQQRGQQHQGVGAQQMGGQQQGTGQPQTNGQIQFNIPNWNGQQPQGQQQGVGQQRTGQSQLGQQGTGQPQPMQQPAIGQQQLGGQQQGVGQPQGAGPQQGTGQQPWNVQQPGVPQPNSQFPLNIPMPQIPINTALRGPTGGATSSHPQTTQSSQGPNQPNVRDPRVSLPSLVPPNANMPQPLPVPSIGQDQANATGRGQPPNGFVPQVDPRLSATGQQNSLNGTQNGAPYNGQGQSNVPPLGNNFGGAQSIPQPQIPLPPSSNPVPPNPYVQVEVNQQLQDPALQPLSIPPYPAPSIPWPARTDTVNQQALTSIANRIHDWTQAFEGDPIKELTPQNVTIIRGCLETFQFIEPGLVTALNTEQLSIEGMYYTSSHRRLLAEHIIALNIQTSVFDPFFIGLNMEAGKLLVSITDNLYRDRIALGVYR